MKRGTWLTIFLVLLVVGFVVGNSHRVLVPVPHWIEFDNYDARTATSLGIGDTAEGQIYHVRADDCDYTCYSDGDWFRFLAEADRSYVFVLKSENVGQRGIWVMEPTEPRMTSAIDASIPHLAFFPDCTPCMFPWTAHTTGIHYFLIRGVSSHGSFIHHSEGSYTIIVTDYADDFPNELRSSAPVAVDSSTRGKIDIPGDQDWFTFDAVQGQVYEIALDNGLSNHSVRLVDEELWWEIEHTGFPMGDATSRFVWTAPESTAYHILVIGNMNRTGDYALTLKLREDHADSIQDSTSIRLNESVKGEITFDNPTDRFHLQVHYGQNAVIMHDPSTPPSLGLYDSDGARMSYDFVQSGWSTECPGDYYLVVSGEAISYWGGTVSYGESFSYDLTYTVTPRRFHALCPDRAQSSDSASAGNITLTPVE